MLEPVVRYVHRLTLEAVGPDLPTERGWLSGRTHRLPASSFIRLGVERAYAKLSVGMILSTTTKRITGATSSMSTTSTKTTSTKKASGAWRNS